MKYCNCVLFVGRFKPGCNTELSEIEAEIKCKLEEVSWMPNFYYLPPDTRIASTKAYQDGKVKICKIRLEKILYLVLSLL